MLILTRQTIMKEREITDSNDTSWSCVEAYSGGNGDHSEKAAALTEGDTVPVVCTPSGGAQSIRLQLPQNWLKALSDEELLNALQAAPTNESQQ